jgi:hypothetical protein
MTRLARTLVGSFRKRLSTAVYADDGWLFQASDVQVEGERRVSRAVAAFLTERAAKALRPMPERADVRWVRDVAPVGLQLPLVAVADSPLLLLHGRSCGCTNTKVNN